MIVLRAIAGLRRRRADPDGLHPRSSPCCRSAKQPIGLAMFAISATFAPAIGPTIGGYLTENWGWEYIFYLNLVPGVADAGAAVDLARAQRHAAWPAAPGRLGGIATMAIGLGALQTVLEEGNKDDWLGSPFIAKLLLVAAVALPAFVWIELPSAHPLLNLRLLLRRNFGFGVLANVPARRRALRLGLHPAGLSRARAGLQCRADRHGAGLDRPAAARADPARAATDEALRRALHRRRGLRPVRPGELHERRDQHRLSRPTSCCCPTSCARSARRWC